MQLHRMGWKTPKYNGAATRIRHMKVSKVTCNGKTGDASVLSPWIAALNNPRIVTEKAGFIFKVGLAGSHLMLAVEPCLIQGERRYHYNLHLAQEDVLYLSGNVDAHGVFMLIAKPRSLPLAAGDKTAFLALYQTFAGLLLAQGYRQAGALDEVTRSVLTELGLTRAATSLRELAD